MAHIISSAKQGLKFCVGELKALTPTTLRAVAITAAVSSYLAMQLYEDANSDENNKSKMNEVIANKSKMQEIIANNCIWLTTAGFGASIGALLGYITSNSTSKCALYGALSGLGTLALAELYRKCQSHQYKESFTTSLRKTQLPEAMRSRYLHEMGDICVLLTILGIGCASGLGANWLLTESPDILRSIIVGFAGGLIGREAYKLKTWVKEHRPF